MNSSLSMFAQYEVDFFPDTVQQLNVALGVNYTYGSTVMNNRFLSKFIFGGYIDREMKDKAYKKLSGDNRLGGDINYKFNVEIPIDTIFRKTGISLIIGMENSEHIDGAFSSDLFKFTFDGNKQFAGTNADIGGTNYNYYNVQRLNLGFVNYKSINDKIAKQRIILSVLKGAEHEAITVPHGSIYTQQLGKEIDVDINYLYNSSDTAKKGLTAFNGWGVSTNLFTEFYLKNGDKVYLGIDDIGFIHWNKNSMEVNTDSTFHFEGVIVDNIFDLNDSLLSNISKDSIIDKISTSNKKGDYSIAMPTSINFNYTKILNEKWKITAGFYSKILSNYFPLIYTDYYYFNKKFVIKAHFSYGGYGKLNTGLAFAKSFSKYFNIFIGTNNLEAFIVPDMAYTNSGFIGLKTYF